MKEIQIKISDCAKHPKLKAFIDCSAKRIIVCAGRRGAKTTGATIKAVKRFLVGGRVLYAAPTQEQVEAAWFLTNQILERPIAEGIYKRNVSRHLIQLEGTKQRIRFKTAWDADTLRGDYADLLILDEWQLIEEKAWGEVGAPMLMDNNGDAIFIYTPLSLHERQRTKARDPNHASKMFKRAQLDKSGRWAAFHWTSRDNGYNDSASINELARDMTNLSYRMEIEAENVDEAPGAIWPRELIEKHRKPENAEYELDRIVIGVDPTGTAAGDEAGIMAVGRSGQQYYVLDDRSLHGRPDQWAREAVNAYKELEADCIVAETNFGGEMVEYTIHTIDPSVNVKQVRTSRGKAVRAEPVAALYEQGKVHHIGTFPRLEDEMCLWLPGDRSPNRMDALVWAVTDLKDAFFRQKGDLGIS